MVLPLAPPPAAQPPGRGAAPALPLPRTIQAGPGPAGLGPRTPPLPPAPSPEPPAPAASGGEEAGAGPTRPLNFLQVHSHASRPFDSQLPGREGPCPPRPLPPGYIRSQRSRPRPRPERRGLRGSRARRAAPLWPRARRPELDGQRGGWRRGAHGPTPLSTRHPHPPTCLPDPRDGSGGSLGRGFRALRALLVPQPRSPSSEGQSVRRPRPAAPATCPKFRCPARELCLPPPPGLSGSAPPGRPAPSALPAAVGAAAAPYVQPAAAAVSAVTDPRARRPGSRCHSAPTSRRARQRAAPAPATPPRPSPPCPAPRRPAAAPAGKRSPRCGSARHAGICSLALWAQDWIQGLGLELGTILPVRICPFFKFSFSSQAVMSRTRDIPSGLPDPKERPAAGCLS